jgi:hypothetical protein
MDKQITVTITFTKEELATLCSCLHDSTSYWYDHMRKAQTEPDYFLNEHGSRLVYTQRSEVYAQMNTMYTDTYGDTEE